MQRQIPQRRVVLTILRQDTAETDTEHVHFNKCYWSEEKQRFFEIPMTVLDFANAYLKPFTSDLLQNGHSLYMVYKWEKNKYRPCHRPDCDYLGDATYLVAEFKRRIKADMTSPRKQIIDPFQTPSPSRDKKRPVEKFKDFLVHWK